MIFEYKEADYYNAYCDQLKDFVLLEYFEDMNDCFQGKLLAKDTIYKLELVVEIPKTFPHNKLYFFTSSLYGYPHLIPCSKGSWFCLNSAFVETTRGQLDEEFDRLRGWIREQMRPELPAIIADAETRGALAVFNTYAKGNADEMNELHTTTEDLIFIGNIWNTVQSDSTEGYFNCVKQRNGKYIVYSTSRASTDKLPFVIVNHRPKDWSSFSSLASEFDWSNELCEKLLPNFNWGKIESGRFACKENTSPFPYPIKENIENDYQYLREHIGAVSIPEEYKEVVKKKLETFVEDCQTIYKKTFETFDEEEDYFDPEYAYNQYAYSLHCFALGVMNDEKLYWYLAYAQQCSVKYEELSFDFGRYEYQTKRVQDIPLHISKSKRVNYDDFFGRGCLTPALTNAKILLIGIGAIGSFVAESLVRGGLRNIVLADGDCVEAGNLCRASFDMEAVGDSKASALRDKLNNISPYCHVSVKGSWEENNVFLQDFKGGDFYGNINYESQENCLKELEKYDLVIDCTASNELLHFLSYAMKNTGRLISVCVTNHAQDCLFLSNANGNVFEQRKHLLAKIEQDSKNFYKEGTGCYAPTFLATASDMLPFGNLAVRKINKSLENSIPIASTVWSYSGDTIVADSIHTYKIENGSIRLVISQSVLDSIAYSPIFEDGQIGILMGGSSVDGSCIFITHVVDMQNLETGIGKIKESSQGVLDYVGNVSVSNKLEYQKAILTKLAKDEEVNVNNPMLAQLNSDGSIHFYLLVENELVPFMSNDDI